MIDTDTVAQALRQATAEVFSTMLELEVQAGEPYLQRDVPGMSEGVIALIGMAGTWIGTGSLSMSATLACKLSSRLLLAEFTATGEAISEEVLDAVAELTNMILGNAKNTLEEQLGPMGLSIPTVIYGRNVTTRSVSDAQWVVVPFLCDQERLEVRLCLALSGQPQPVRHGYRPAHCLQF
jgi:chemotaxis protein CheX